MEECRGGGGLGKDMRMEGNKLSREGRGEVARRGDEGRQ